MIHFYNLKCNVCQKIAKTTIVQRNGAKDFKALHSSFTRLGSGRVWLNWSSCFIFLSSWHGLLRYRLAKSQIYNKMCYKDVLFQKKIRHDNRSRNGADNLRCKVKFDLSIYNIILILEVKAIFPKIFVEKIVSNSFLAFRLWMFEIINLTNEF